MQGIRTASKQQVERNHWLKRLWVLTFALVALSVALLPVSRASDDSPVVSTTTTEGRLAVFDDAWETIEERYYDPGFHGIDWQAKRIAYRPAAARANSVHEFYEVLRQMINSLRDAHTRVYSPEEKFDWWNPRFITTGLTIREVDGLPVVVGIDEQSAAAQKDIHLGDVIVSVDRTPVTELINKRLENSNATEGLTRSRVIATLLEGPAGSPVEVRWQLRNGKTTSTTLQRHWSQRQLGFTKERKGKLAVLRLDAFTQSVALDFSRMLPDTLRGADSIVLDLRGNGGGDAEAMADVASLFLDDG